jgi:hypothetical protein
MNKDQVYQDDFWVSHRLQIQSTEYYTLAEREN